MLTYHGKWSDANLKDEPTFELKTANYNHSEYLRKKKDADDAYTNWQNSTKNAGDLDALNSDVSAAEENARKAKAAFDDADKVQGDQKKTTEEINELRDAQTQANQVLEAAKAKKKGAEDQGATSKQLKDAYDQKLKVAENAFKNHPDNLFQQALQKVNDWDQALRDAQNLVDENPGAKPTDPSKAPDSAWNIIVGIAAKGQRITRAMTELEAAKARFVVRKRDRDEFKVKEDMYTMRNKNSKNTKAAAEADLRNIRTQLTTLREKLKEGRKHTVTARQAVVDVAPSGENKALSLVRSDPILTGEAAIATANDGDDSDKADVWTKISFSVSAKNEQTSSSAQSYDAGFQAKYSGWFYSVEASSHVSSASEELKKSMASCDMTVSL
jgi:DNA repair exonuclease SbcCD ATPase subunit